MKLSIFIGNPKPCKYDRFIGRPMAKAGLILLLLFRTSIEAIIPKIIREMFPITAVEIVLKNAPHLS